MGLNAESGFLSEIDMDNNIVISVIIPVYNGADTVHLSLKSAYSSEYNDYEVILVDDNSTDHTLSIVNNFPCKVIRLDQNAGPAAARNRGAEISRGEILFFLDSDIIIEKDTLKQIAATFHAKPEISALFCSYQKNTIPADFFSAYKNLIHHYTHQTSLEEAATFCAGFGAIKREAFFGLRGFDESYRSLEDIELGYRLHSAGLKTYLSKKIQVTHCKKYSFVGLIKSDVLHRAIPWTEIMLNKKFFRSDLNIKINNVFSVPVAFLILLTLPTLPFYSNAIYIFLFLLMLLLLLNRNFYLFVLEEKGVSFTIKTVLMNWFNYLYSGIGFICGVLSFLKNFLFKIKIKSGFSSFG